eukprot:245248-Amphidinium_carterae.1
MKQCGHFIGTKIDPEVFIPKKELTPARKCGGKRLCCIRRRPCRIVYNPTRPGDCMWASISHMVKCRTGRSFRVAFLRSL